MGCVTQKGSLLIAIAINRRRQDLNFMSSNPFTRRLVAVVGGGALIAMGAFVAGCGNNGEQTPSTTTTTTTTTTTPPSSSAAPPSPTEKGINPTGGNLFTPDIKAPPAPTEPPGVHRNN
jgi:hypothetical protein